MRTSLMLLWHMHQPFYKDLVEGTYAMPWVRMHALKDYFGMVAMLEEFPNVHMTFNLVPSLVAQLEDYAADTAREEPFRIAFRPVDELTEAERLSLLSFAFHANRDNLIFRIPRFRELFERIGAEESAKGVRRIFSPQDLLDLQVVSQLAWFDEIYLASDSAIRGLIEKGRGYTEQDKAILRSKELELFKVTLEVYRKAQARGQIEISTSPFYHPILPLVADSEVAAESHPGVKLPGVRFQHPEDAREQLRAARRLHERVFGSPPRGLWPSEGSVSDEILWIAAQEGFEWAATDEGVLGRSLGMGFYRRSDGTLEGGRELYRPYRLRTGGREIALFFRDHQISDLIGFVYSRMDARAAAEDLHQRIRAAGRSAGDHPAVVSIVLDGENAWEFFPGNGREFLREFYSRMASDAEVQALTASEALAVAETGSLSHVVPGSWINANFDVWIGAEEDNRAWELLAEARRVFAEQAARSKIEPERLERARQELWIAEGSDWCWWYGPEHTSAHDEEFDRLYRQHLSNIYRSLGLSPPDELAVPIKRPRAHALTVPPSAAIAPRVDGQVTNYFEWLGAGLYLPDYHSGSMHGGAEFVEALYYGFSEKSLFLRVDFSSGFLERQEAFEVRVMVDGQSRLRLHAAVSRRRVSSVLVSSHGGELAAQPAAGDQMEVAFARIFELRLDYALLGLHPNDQTALQVALWADNLPVQIVPQEGWLNLQLTEEVVSW